MRITTTIKTVIITFSLLCSIAVCYANDPFVEYDENGNPIESTEIPADQIPPDTRPAIDIAIFDLDMGLEPIIVEHINTTVFLVGGVVEGFQSIGITDKSLANSITSAESGIKSYIQFLDTAHPKNYVQDKRTLAHMTVDDTPAWRKWQAIYSAAYQPVRHVPVVDVLQIRMLTEMRAAETNAAYDNLVSELAYFKALTYTKKVNGVPETFRQYNTVLAVWEGENTSKLLQQIALARSMGYKVFFSYGKKEKLTDGVFIDPDEYRTGLIRLASASDGYIIGWRRAGLHLFKQDDKWTSFSMQCAREGNPNIPIFGGIYHGFAGEFDANGKEIFKLYINIPANASGAFVTNLGYAGLRADKIFEMLRQYTTVPMIAGIVGEKAYYMSRNNTNRTKAKNREIIARVERRFQRAGFGTATLAGDGSNELYNKDVSDDLCKSQWSKTTISN